MSPSLHLFAAVQSGLDNLHAPNTAVLSPCRTWRYLLRRTWNELVGDAARRCLFVMLNPSTADENVDDATIRKCIGFGKRWGYDGIEVVNLFAFRATDPKALKQQTPAQAEGPRNDEFILDAAARAKTTLIVAAWGNHGQLYNRNQFVVGRLVGLGHTLRCFKVTKTGMPEHPLYQPYEREPERYP